MRNNFIHFGKYERELTGKGYFSEGIICLNEYNFNDAYSLFLDGLDLVTCDCNNTNWRDGIDDALYEMFEYDEYSLEDGDRESYYFCKAFILSYEENKDILMNALKCAVKYEKVVCGDNQINEYANYLIGRILLQLDYPYLALHYFKFILNYCNPKNIARINYRIGRTMEQYELDKNTIQCEGFSMDTNGLQFLSDSLIENCSSACCARVLQYHARQFNTSYLINERYFKNEIIKMFITIDNDIEFQKKYNNYIENQIWDEKSDFTDFIDFLLHNRNTYMNYDQYTYFKSFRLTISRIIQEEEPPLYIIFPDRFGQNKLKNPPLNKHFIKGELERIYEYNESRKFEDDLDDDFLDNEWVTI